MEMTLRPMAGLESLYCYKQSQQIMAQTGCIGHLRLDCGPDGKDFYSSWDDHSSHLNTPEFKAFFDAAVNALRSDAQYRRILRSRSDMASCCYSQPDSQITDREYGFRADSDSYTLMLRLNPHRGEYSYLYCYRRDWLELHMAKAQRGIRFITPDYQEQFRIQDGGKISITQPDGRKMARTCRYIDDYHLEVGNDLYHICEFAEYMERCGSKVTPLQESLLSPSRTEKHREER